MLKFSLDQAEFISFAMGKPLRDYPHDFLIKGHTGFNKTDIQFDEISPIPKKFLQILKLKIIILLQSELLEFSYIFFLFSLEHS